MNTLLEAIKQHQNTFIYTLQSRASTTPSESNKRNHMLLAAHIESGNWKDVSEIIQAPQYRSGLEGVVICLSLDYDYSVKSEIIELFKEGKLV